MWKLSLLLTFLQIESGLCLCAIKRTFRGTRKKINAPLTYEVLGKDMMTSEILSHSSVAEHGYLSKKVAWREFFQYVLYK